MLRKMDQRDVGPLRYQCVKVLQGHILEHRCVEFMPQPGLGRQYLGSLHQSFAQ